MDKKKSYFNLLVKPNQRQTLTLLLTNTGKKVYKAKITPVSAYTSDSGNVAYKTYVDGSRRTSKLQFSDLVSKKQVVQLKPGETRRINFRLTVPAQKFSGMIMGGFEVSDSAKKKPSNSDSRVQVTNRYQLVMGATLQEQKKLTPPNLKLLGVKSVANSGSPEVVGELSSPTSTLFGDLDISAVVRKKGSSKPILQNELKNMVVAPATNFNYHLKWGRVRVAKGNYVLSLEATSGTKRWYLSQSFNISAQQALKLNHKEEKTKLDISKALILVLLPVILFVGFSFYRWLKWKRDSIDNF